MKHVTVNADHALVADQIVSGKTTDAGTAALLASGTEKPIENLKPSHKEAVPAIATGHRQSE